MLLIFPLLFTTTFVSTNEKNKLDAFIGLKLRKTEFTVAETWGVMMYHNV